MNAIKSIPIRLATPILIRMCDRREITTKFSPIFFNPIESNVILNRVKQKSDHSQNKKYTLAAAIVLGLNIISLNSAECAVDKQKVTDFLLSQTFENLLKLILGLSSETAGILASILEPQMLGDPESEMFQKERQARGKAMQMEANTHLKNIQSLPKSAKLSMSQMDIIKSICPLDVEPGVIFLGRYIPYSKLHKAIQEAQKIEKRNK